VTAAMTYDDAVTAVVQ